jgi:Tfp pilus assembly protein PilF
MDEAIKRLQDAVAKEDGLVYQEPRDWTFPSRSNLGNALLKAKKYDEASAVFERELIDWPENGFALAGLQKAMDRAGKKKEAEALSRRVQQAMQYADQPMSAAAL